MKKYRLIRVLFALILLACLVGAQGQYSAPSSIYSTTVPISVGNPNVPVSAVTPNSNFDYSQFYVTSASRSIPSTPEAIDVAEMMLPTTVYLGNQMQPVNYAQYRANPTSSASIALWIQGTTSWSQYASVPQGATVSLLAVSSGGGNGYLTFIDADGKSSNYNYYFYPYSRLTFYADLPGRHILSFAVNGKTSNQVIIDVTGTYVPPSNYALPTASPGYLNDYYPYGYPYGYPYSGYYPTYPYYSYPYDNFHHDKEQDHDKKHEHESDQDHTQEHEQDQEQKHNSNTALTPSGQANRNLVTVSSPRPASAPKIGVDQNESSRISIAIPSLGAAPTISIPKIGGG